MAAMTAYRAMLEFEIYGRKPRIDQRDDIRTELDRLKRPRSVARTTASRRREELLAQRYENCLK